MSDNPDPIDIAKQFIKENHPDFDVENSKISTNTHNAQHDLHFTKLVPGLSPENLDENPYHVVSFVNEKELGDGTKTHNIFKVTVKGNKVAKVLISK